MFDSDHSGWDPAHLRHMARALRLAALGRHASPNPMVGCVLTEKDGDAVSEGYHAAPGQPHAEAAALSKAPQYASHPPVRAYVTLEPCSHYGRTPPCADALIRAGIKEVFVAMLDPDVRVSGRGVERLRAHGVAVHVGGYEAAARRLNAAYIKHRETHVPYVVLKTAMTLDGKIATHSGDSQWITSDISRRAVHRQLRDRCDAIITGAGTVTRDDPSLTARLRFRAGRNPWRIVVDSRLRISPEAQVVRRSAEDGRTILATTEAAAYDRQETFLALGCHIMVCEPGADGKVSLRDLVHKLGTRGDMIGVLVEAGSELGGAFVRSGLVDRFVAFVAPKIVGGRGAPGPIGGDGVNLMADAFPLTFQSVRRSGPDFVVNAHWVEYI